MKIELEIRLARDGMPPDGESVILTTKRYVATEYYNAKRGVFEDSEGSETPVENVLTWIPTSEYWNTVNQAINAPLKWAYRVHFGYSNGNPFDDAYFSTLEKAKQFEQELRDEDDPDADADDTVQTYIERVSYIEGMELDDEEE